MTDEYTYADWVEEAERRFGGDSAHWAFVCPSCGYRQTVRMYKEAGAPESAVAFSCVGRWMKEPKDAFDKKGTGPCNYAGGGLFRLNPVKVVRDGKVHEVFAFGGREIPDAP